MIKKFLKFNIMNESLEQQLLDKILDKINIYGFDNLSDFEKKVLKKASSDGIESLSSFLDKEEELNYDDSTGRILINGIPYDEWSKQQSEKKDKNEYNWNSSNNKSSNINDYEITVYKNFNSKVRYFYVIFKGQIDGIIKIKMISEDNDKKKYGVVVNVKKTKWTKMSINDIFKDISKEYDQYKKLTLDETNDFETFLNLRSSYRKGKLDDNNIQKINYLFNKFSNI